MISRDYTQEVGVVSQKKMVPRPLAFVILAIIAGGVFFGMAAIIRETKQQHAAERAATAAESAGSQAASPAKQAPAAAPAPAPAAEPTK
jgi:type II secretory pathway pseudopilin PulG